MGIAFDVPGRQSYRIDALVLDLNGTLAVDGRLRSSTLKLLRELSRQLTITIVTADTNHSAAEIQHLVGETMHVHVLPGDDTTTAKRRFIQERGPGQTAAVGNGANDLGMLEEAVLSIAVLEAEGCSADLLCKADLVVRSIDEALELFLNPNRIVATLRR